MAAREPRTALVTGATDGLGRALAERLAAGGFAVVLHGRSPQRLAEAATQIRLATGAERIRTACADFASLEDVRRMARELGAALPALHVLVNNAGLGSGAPDGTTRQESRDGHELRFAVNHLAGFLLTLELTPLLRRSAPARVVNVASVGQQAIDFEDPMVTCDYSGTRAYCQSKLAQVACGFELAERLAGSGVTVNSLHPADYMPTKIVLEEIGHTIDALSVGVEATVRLATAPELAGVTGRYFERGRQARAHRQAYDPAARRRLWELSERLTGARLPDEQSD